MESLLYNEDEERRISNQDELKPGLTRVMEATKQKTDYEPGSADYHEAAVQVAKQLANSVTEDNSDSSYEEVMDIDSDVFGMLDKGAGQNGVLNEEQADGLYGGEAAMRHKKDGTGAVYGGRNLADIKERSGDLETDADYAAFARSIFDVAFRYSKDPSIALEAVESAERRSRKLYNSGTKAMQREISRLDEAVDQIEQDVTPEWDEESYPWKRESVSVGEIKREL